MNDNDVKDYWHKVPQDEKNKIVGDAIDAWLEKKYAAFGKWTLRSVAAAAFAALVFYLFTHNWLGRS